MNLLQRVLRLPFVASSSTFQPFLNTGLITLGLLGVIKKNSHLNTLPVHQPVVKSNPLQILSHFISIYKNLRDSSVENEFIWLFKKTTLVVKNLFSMLFINDSGNAVSDFPHMLAGKIESKHLIPGTGGHVYVLALSEGALASLGFLAFLCSRILTYVIFVFVLKKASAYFYNKLFKSSKVFAAEREVIDVSSKDFKKTVPVNNREKPLYLQNYIKNRNAE